ncbi:MAG: SAM-dependent methyltransferase [Fimbriimonadaceae bacterium]
MNEKLVSEHYESGKLLDLILRGLKESGKDIENLEVGDLSPVDEFHIRGRESTVELAEKADLSSGMRVLDVGCGIGGSARYLASEYGVRVSGVDLTREFIEVGQKLNQMVGMSDVVDLQVASALELPFEDGSFEVVWTEHVQMNIEDKPGFYGEMARVLKPGGKLMFHDVFAGEGGAVHFPVPWADGEAISFLIGVAEVKELIVGLGFEDETWDDISPVSAVWFEETLKRMDAVGPRPLGLHLLIGDRSMVKFRNILRNLQEGRISTVQGVLRKKVD